MREALIVWGGWSGHEPEEGAAVVAGMLREEGFTVRVENTTAAFAEDSPNEGPQKWRQAHYRGDDDRRHP